MKKKSSGIFFLVFALILAACEAGNYDGEPGLSDDPAPGEEGEFEELPSDADEVYAFCIDRDGDGYGQDCRLGPDCNDRDSSFGAECPPKEERCDNLPTPEPCYRLEGITDSTIRCGIGVRHCIEGHWGRCEIESIEEKNYSSAALIAAPVECDPCEPQCSLAVSAPKAGDLDASNADEAVAYSAAVDGITLSSGADEVDTDGDGVPDVYDAFPNDPTQWAVVDGSRFYMLPFGAPPIYDPIDIDLELDAADVYFLMDTTQSMQGEIDNLRHDLTNENFVVDPTLCNIADQFPTFSTWSADFYDNPDLLGSPAFSRDQSPYASGFSRWSGTNTPILDNDGLAFPAAAHSRNFSVRWTNTVEVPADAERTNTFRIWIDKEDGIRVLWDGSLIPMYDDDANVFADPWTGASFQSLYADIPFTEGTHTLVFEYAARGTWSAIWPSQRLSPAPGYEGIIGAVQCEIPNVNFGVGRFDDFPWLPYGYDGVSGGCGSYVDKPYQNLLSVTSPETVAGKAAIQSAVDQLQANCGTDTPESHYAAVMSIALGMGIDDGREVGSTRPTTEPDKMMATVIPDEPTTTFVLPEEPALVPPGDPCKLPATWSATYFDNINFTAPAARTETVNILDLRTRHMREQDGQFYHKGPDLNISARYEATVNFAVAKTCSYTVKYDDTFVMYVDGVPVYSGNTYTGWDAKEFSHSFAPGSHTITIEHAQGTGNRGLNIFEGARCALPTTFTREGFRGRQDLSGAPDSVDTYVSPDSYAMTEARFPGDGGDNYSMRLTGDFTLSEARNCIYELQADDRGRVYIDGALVVDGWSRHTYGSDKGLQAMASLGAGTHTMTIEYREGTGSARLLVYAREKLTYNLRVEDPHLDIGVIPPGQAIEITGDTTNYTTSQASRRAGTFTNAAFIDFTLPEPRRLSVTTTGSTADTGVDLWEKTGVAAVADKGGAHMSGALLGVDGQNAEKTWGTLPAGDYRLMIGTAPGTGIGGPVTLRMGTVMGAALDDAMDLGTLNGRWFNLLAGGNGSGSWEVGGWGRYWNTAPSCPGNEPGTNTRAYRMKFNLDSEAIVAFQGYEGREQYFELLDSDRNLIYCQGAEDQKNTGDSKPGALIQKLPAGEYYLIFAQTRESDAIRLGVGEYKAEFQTIVPPQTSCAAGTHGYPCFRDEATPVVVLFTDANAHGHWHYKTGGEYSHPAVRRGDVNYALKRSGVKVVGVNSGGAPSWRCNGGTCLEYSPTQTCTSGTRTRCNINPGTTTTCGDSEVCEQGVCWEEYGCSTSSNPCPAAEQYDEPYTNCGNECIDLVPNCWWDTGGGGERTLRDFAQASGAVRPDGSHLVYQIGSDGKGLGAQVVKGISDLANLTRQDVSLRVNDNPATAGVDERDFIASISTVTTPLNPGDPMPLTNTRCGAVHATWYEACTPGTPVKFNVGWANSTVPPAATPTTYTFTVDVMANGATILDTIEVTVVVPPDGDTLPEEGRHWRDLDAQLRCNGRLPEWRELRYDATIPADTSLGWEIALADIEADLDTVTPITFESAVDASPIDLIGPIEDAGLARKRYMRVTAVLRSDAATRSKAPVVREFAVEWDCIDDD